MPVIRYRRPADRRSRAQRWCDAVGELVTLQARICRMAQLRFPTAFTPRQQEKRYKPSRMSTSTPRPTSIRPVAMAEIDSKETPTKTA